MSTRLTTLASGATVASVELPGLESAAFGLYFPTGSRHETADNNGISHFIEHLVFKGTPSRSADQVNREIDLLGGGVNAYTSKETLCFHARVLAEELPRAIELLGDLAANAMPDGVEAEVDREREVILAEISAVEDSPEDLVSDLADRAWFGEHPLALPVVGSASAVQRLALPDLRTHFRQHLVASNMVVAAAGRVDHGALVELAERYFAAIPLSGDAHTMAPPRPRPTSRVEARELEQVQVSLGADGVALNDSRRPAAELLSLMLGEGCSSRLFREVRDRRGLAYSVYSGLSSYADSGSLQIGFGTAPEKLDETLEVVECVLREVRDGGLEADELEAARRHARTSTLLASEASGARMAHLAEHLLFGSEEFEIARVLQRIAEVRLADVRALAAELFAEPLALAAVGPVESGQLPLHGLDLGR